jgi:putative heme transporter
VVAALVTVVVVRLVGRVDWGEVRDALTELAWWQVPLLAAVLVVRQVLNALPLSLYIPGVSAVRATQNDQVAILMSTVAPPPSDIALRMAMFSSWGVPVPKGMAGTVMNTLTFYVVRFGAPAVGFVLLAVTGGPVGYRWADLVSIAVAVAILAGLLLVVRSDALARTVGRRAGAVATRVRRTVDPDAWSDACVRFRADVAARFRRGFPRSLLALAGMLAVDLTLLVLALRFVGVGAHEVALVEVAIAYLFAYPFTLFPFSGLGIVDALVLAAAVEAGGPEVEAAVVAGLLVWRVFTIGGPLALGAGALAAWRAEEARK